MSCDCTAHLSVQQLGATASNTAYLDIFASKINELLTHLDPPLLDVWRHAQALALRRKPRKNMQHRELMRRQLEGCELEAEVVVHFF